MQIYMKNTIKVAVPPAAAAAAAGTPQSDIIDVTATVIKPKEERERKVRAGLSCDAVIHLVGHQHAFAWD